MANPILPTNGTHELQEKYADSVLKIARKKNILRAEHSGREYEGDPKSGAIKVPVRDTEAVIGNYDVVAGATLTTSATEYKTILVDKNKAVNELIDGYEAEAVPDDLVAQRLVSAGYGFGRVANADFIAELDDNGTAETSTTASDSNSIYGNISNTIGELTKLGIDKESLVVAIPTDTESLLLNDTKYTNTASNVGAERAMSGVVNLIRGVPVVIDDNMPVVDEYMVYSKDFAQAGNAWEIMPQVKDLADGKHIGSSALQGRLVYWNELTRSYGARIKRKALVLTVTSAAGTKQGDTLVTVTTPALTSWQ